MKFLCLISLLPSISLLSQVPDVMNGGTGFTEFNGTWSKASQTLLYPAAQIGKPSSVQSRISGLYSFPEFISLSVQGNFSTALQSYGMGFQKIGQGDRSIRTCYITFAQKISESIQLALLMNYLPMPSDTRNVYQLNAGFSLQFQQLNWTLNATWKGFNFGSISTPSTGCVLINYLLSRNTELGLASYINGQDIEYQFGIATHWKNQIEFHTAFSPGRNIVVGGLIQHQSIRYSMHISWKDRIGLAYQCCISYEI